MTEDKTCDPVAFAGKGNYSPHTLRISSKPLLPEPMKIIKAYPPNYAALLAKFGDVVRGDVIFSYGDRIFCPSGRKLHPALIAHEEVHGARQRILGVELWWENYLADPEFRFIEEVLAHHAEWIHFKWMTNPMPSEKLKRNIFRQICERLSGPLYGNMVTYEHAAKILHADMISSVELADGKTIDV